MQIKRFADAYAVCKAKLDRRGIGLELVNEGEAIQDVLLAVGKPYLTPHLSPLENSFTESNSFWVVATKDDQVVFTGGVRFDDIGSERLSSFWQREVARFYKNHDGPPRLVVDPLLDDLVPSGRICYMGDLISVPNAQSPLDLRNFALAVQMLACMEWRPDMTCAFVSDRHARRNAGMHYGFLSTALRIHEWINPPYPRTNREHFLYSTSTHLQLLAKEITREATDSSRSEQAASDPAPIPTSKAADT